MGGPKGSLGAPRGPKGAPRGPLGAPRAPWAPWATRMGPRGLLGPLGPLGGPTVAILAQGRNRFGSSAHSGHCLGWSPCDRPRPLSLSCILPSSG